LYTREDLEREGLLDFRVFLIHVWAYLNLPKPTKVQLDIAYWLQHGPQRAILQAFRGVGKSWITVAFVLWQLLLDPQKNIMVVSANEKAATDFTIFCKQLINGMPLLQHLRSLPGQRDAADAFDVGPAEPDKNPSVKSVGITGQLTGSRADIIIPDDIEIPKNSQTFLLRERLGELVKEFDAILKPGLNSRVIYLGTPQVEDTLYLKLQSRGYVTSIWPVQIPERPEVYRGCLGRLITRMIAEGAKPGTLVEPDRFGEEKCAANLLSYGRSGYNLQFMLDTTASDAEKYPLKLKDLIVHDCDPEMAHVQLVWGGSNQLTDQGLRIGGLDGDYYVRAAWQSPEMTKYTSTVMAIDPSGKGKDETGFAIIKYLNGFLYLVDVGGFLDGFAEGTLASLAGKALRWKVNNIIIEENYGGGMFNQLLKPHLIRAFGNANNGKLGSAGAIDEEWNGWSSTQKEMRILDTLEPILQSHRLVVDRAVLERDWKQQEESHQYSFIYQMTRMARVKGCLPHEDRLESVSMCCQYFVEKMNKDASRARDQHKAAMLEKELRNWHRHVHGIKGVSGDLVRS
jgi:hypothetical protein